MALTHRQANDLRRHLIQELNTKGFGVVADEASISLFEEEAAEKLSYSPETRLTSFIENVIQSLRTFSSAYLPIALERIRNNVENAGNLDTFLVEPDLGINDRLTDLRKLPDYEELIESFQEILTEIQNDNDDIRAGF